MSTIQYTRGFYETVTITPPFGFSPTGSAYPSSDAQPQKYTYPYAQPPSYSQQQPSYPQPFYPQPSSYPQPFYPQPSSYPQSSYPQPFYPQPSSYPQSSYPQPSSYPQSSYPQSSYPQPSSYPQSSYPQPPPYTQHQPSYDQPRPSYTQLQLPPSNYSEKSTPVQHQLSFTKPITSVDPKPTTSSQKVVTESPSQPKATEVSTTIEKVVTKLEPQLKVALPPITEKVVTELSSQPKAAKGSTTIEKVVTKLEPQIEVDQPTQPSTTQKVVTTLSPQLKPAQPSFTILKRGQSLTQAKSALTSTKVATTLSPLLKPAKPTQPLTTLKGVSKLSPLIKPAQPTKPLTTQKALTKLSPLLKPAKPTQASTTQKVVTKLSPLLKPAKPTQPLTAQKVVTKLSPLLKPAKPTQPLTAQKALSKLSPLIKPAQPTKPLTTQKALTKLSPRLKAAQPSSTIQKTVTKVTQAKPAKKSTDTAYMQAKKTQASIIPLLEQSTLIRSAPDQVLWDEVCDDLFDNFDLTDCCEAIVNFAYQYKQYTIKEKNKILAKNRKMLDDFTRIISKHSSELTSHQIARLAFSFGKIGIGDRRLFASLSSAAQTKIKEFNSTDLSDLAWGLGKAGWDDMNLFQLIGDEAIAKMEDFSDYKLASLCWAFGACNIAHVNLFTAVAKRVNGQGIVGKNANTQIAWAFAVVAPDLLNFDQIFDYLNTLEEPIEEIEAITLFHVALARDLSWDKRDHLRQQVQRLCTEHMKKTPESSRLHKEVSAVLSLIVDHENEIYKSGYFIDILITGQAVAVEVDGPLHRLLCSGRIKGSDVLKQQVLEKCGLIVVHIPDTEWYRLGNSIDAQKQYLKEKLESILAPDEPTTSVTDVDSSTHMPKKPSHNIQSRDKLQNRLKPVIKEPVDSKEHKYPVPTPIERPITPNTKFNKSNSTKFSLCSSQRVYKG